MQHLAKGCVYMVERSRSTSVAPNHQTTLPTVTKSADTASAHSAVHVRVDPP